MYINGKFVESRSGKWIDVLNPSTEEVCSRQPEGTVEDVEEALDAARAAQKSWEKTPAIERAAYLSKMADGIRKREKEFVEIIMREQGKTRSWAQIEVGATIAYFDYMASFARHIEGEIIQSDNRGETIFLSKKPIGVVAGILPWNFPFFLIARKAGAALIAAGAAAKAGLAALANKGSTSTAMSSNSASSSSSKTQTVESEMTIYVTGRISGSDILISGQRTAESWAR